MDAPVPIWAWAHTRANFGSAGQARPGRCISQPDRSKRAPELVNTHTLCCAIVINIGKLLVNAATVAPIPRTTSIMGKAQQIRVPLAANSVSQSRPVSFSTTSLLVVSNFRHAGDLLSYQVYNLELTPGQVLFFAICDLVHMELDKLDLTPGSRGLSECAYFSCGNAASACYLLICVQTARISLMRPRWPCTT